MSACVPQRRAQRELSKSLQFNVRFMPSAGSRPLEFSSRNNNLLMLKRGSCAEPLREVKRDKAGKKNMTILFYDGCSIL
jgi:hypothetical protein